MAVWQTTVADYGRLIGERFPAHRGRSPFKGLNFMTPEILGVVTVAGRIVEISTGIGMFGDRLFGITVHPTRGESRMVESLEEVVAVLEGFTPLVAS